MKIYLSFLSIVFFTLSCGKNYNEDIDPFFFPLESYKDNFVINEYNQIGEYYYLCKVWGFLKYHHEKVKKGEVEWDSVLINVIPKIDTDLSKTEFRRMILELINKAGKLENMNQHKIPQTKYYINDDLNWFNDTVFLSSEIKDKLISIQVTSEVTDDNFYARQTAYGNLNYDSEKSYSEKRVLQKRIRLLALFRYWNVINYFYPYKYDLHKSWNEVLYKYIPKFYSCNNEIDYNYLILLLSKEIEDSHSKTSSKILKDVFGKYICNFDVEAVDSCWVVKGFRVKKYLNNLKVGDLLLKLNSKTIGASYDSVKEYISASNEACLKRDAGKFIFRSHSKSNKLTVLRDGDTIELISVFYCESKLWEEYISERRSYARQNVGRIIHDSIGYIRCDQIFDNNIDISLDWLLPITKAIILDYRGYPNGTYEKLLEKFYNGTGIFWHFTYPDLNYPGVFKVSEHTPKIDMENNSSIYNGKLIILIDENTQSHAEFSVMAFQLQENIEIIGRYSAGANGNVSVLKLPGGIKTSFSGIGVFYPNMKKMQRIGIVPNIIVEKTLECAVKGEDEILNKAISFNKKHEKECKNSNNIIRNLFHNICWFGNVRL